MARIPDDLVDRVRQYAGRHQLNTSALIRDALECYISNEDILSYRYRNMSDINKNVSDTFEESPLPRLADTGMQDLQAMVDAAVQKALEKVNGMVTRAPEAPGEPVSEPSYDNNTGIQQGASRRPGRPATMRQRILSLLSEHAEGLSAEQIRAYLSPEKPLGDTLQGMRRSGVVRTQGSGNTMQYFVA
jgi:hypothetical protein